MLGSYLKIKILLQDQPAYALNAPLLTMNFQSLMQGWVHDGTVVFLGCQLVILMIYSGSDKGVSLGSVTWMVHHLSCGLRF